MGKDVIVYKIFLECQKFAFVPFWEEIIYNCACNHFPKGVRYNDGVFFIKYNNGRQYRSESFQLPYDSFEIYKLMMYIFKELLGLRSEYDLELSKQEFEEIRRCCEIDLDCEWKKLKPKSIKTQMLMDFAVSEISSRKLPPREAKRLFNIIQLGFQFKKITNDDVEYKAGVVKSISGLKFDDEKQDFVITIRSSKRSRNDMDIKRSIPQTKNHLYQALDKWIKGYKTHRILF